MKQHLTSLKEKCVGFIKGVWNKHLSYDDKTLKRLAVLATALYAWLLIWGLWLKFNDNLTIMLNHSWLSKMTLRERFMYDIVPFNIRFDRRIQTMQLFYNAFAFAPLGVLLGFLFKKSNIWRDLIICFCTSLCIELLQLFTIIGAFATHDLIMNTLGYFIGLLAYKLFFNKMSVKFNVIFFFAVDVLAIGITAYSIVRTVQNIEPIIMILTGK